MVGDPEDTLVIGRGPVVDLDAIVVRLDDPSLGILQPHCAATKDQELVARFCPPTVTGSEPDPLEFRAAHVG